MAIDDFKKSFGELTVASLKYGRKFGEEPPTFGYSEDEALSSIYKAIESNEPMLGLDEVLEKELDIKTKNGRKAIIT